MVTCGGPDNPTTTTYMTDFNVTSSAPAIIAGVCVLARHLFATLGAGMISGTRTRRYDIARERHPRLCGCVDRCHAGPEEDHRQRVFSVNAMNLRRGVA